MWLGVKNMKNNVMIAEKERLILRKYAESDLEDLYEYLSNPKVVEFEPYQPMTFEEVKQELKERIASNEMIAVELKENHKLIGNVYLGKREFHALEMGYVFNDAYWNRGYARESCIQLMNLAFEHGVHRIYAECDPENKNSWKLLEALGFTREAHLRKNVYFWYDEKGEPIWKDTFIYGISKEKTI